MMQATIDRGQTTRKSFAASTGIHSLLLLVIVLFAGRGAAHRIEQADELTQISYIEAKYGEDVAKKVRMKTRKGLPDAPKGPGIETRSAMKPKAPSPTPAFTPQPSLAADVSAPRLERPDPTFTAPQNERLQSRGLAAPKNAGLAPESVKRDAAIADAGGTPKLSSRVSGSPKLPEAGRALVSRGKARLDAGGPDVPGRVTGDGGGAAELSPATPSLQSRGSGSGTTPGYSAPSGSLQDRGAGQADLDVGGTPAPGGGSAGTSGRRTVLDYGSGGGGGGLEGRAGGLREAPAKPAPNSSKAVEQEIAEAAPVEVGGKGTSMTISGQIAGRKILHSVPPEYSKQARQKGWEGVVAVHFTVLADGRVKDNVYFEQTSAHRDLNQAAMAAIKQFEFAPLPADKAAVEQWGVITIVFRLN
jgi:TonB family protein